MKAAVVPTPDELVTAEDGVSRPSLQNGSAQALPMSAQEMAKVKRLKRIPFGFRAPA